MSNKELREEIKRLEEAIASKRKSIGKREKRIKDITKYREAMRAYIV